MIWISNVSLFSVCCVALQCCCSYSWYSVWDLLVAFFCVCCFWSNQQCSILISSCIFYFCRKSLVWWGVFFSSQKVNSFLRLLDFSIHEFCPTVMLLYVLMRRLSMDIASNPIFSDIIAFVSKCHLLLAAEQAAELRDYNFFVTRKGPYVPENRTFGPLRSLNARHECRAFSFEEAFWLSVTHQCLSCTRCVFANQLSTLLRRSVDEMARAI